MRGKMCLSERERERAAIIDWASRTSNGWMDDGRTEEARNER